MAATRMIRVVGTGLLWTALGFAATMLLAITLPNLLGYRSLTVLSGSMEPTLMTGDMVISKWMRPDQAKVGDLVTFQSAESRKLITHRVRSVKINGDRVDIATKGDANDTVEHWQAPSNGRVSRVEYDVPKVGYLTNLVSTTKGKLLMVVLPAILLAIYELVRLWRPEPRPKGRPEGSGQALRGTHA